MPGPRQDAVDPHFKLLFRKPFKIYQNGYNYLGLEIKDQDVINEISFRFRSVLSPDSHNGPIRGPRDICHSCFFLQLDCISVISLLRVYMTPYMHNRCNMRDIYNYV